MKHIRLAHLGDVHYPDSIRETLADVKDLSFPPAVTESMLVRPLQAVVRDMTMHFRESPVDGLLLSGDLTSRGSVGDYSTCLEYLDEALDLSRWGPEHVHVVPGNHDVARDRIAEPGSALAKFEPFQAAWVARKLPVLAVEGVRATAVRRGCHSIAVFSLNSSIGCGEKRHLPPEIADELAALLAKHVTRASTDEAFALVGETLDTPGFREGRYSVPVRAVEGSGLTHLTDRGNAPQSVAASASADSAIHRSYERRAYAVSFAQPRSSDRVLPRTHSRQPDRDRYARSRTQQSSHRLGRGPATMPWLQRSSG